MSRVTAIRRDTLKMILEASRDSHPLEFGAILRAEEGVVSELLLVPGTIGGQSHAIFRLHNLPVDFTVVGSVHSHPSPDPRPSRQDIEFFQHIGYIHIIVAHPYDEASWRAWDRQGDAYPLTIVE